MSYSYVLNIANKTKPWSSSQKGDLILSIVALSQLLLATLQGVMIAMGMDKDVSTTYRVVMSAFTIVVSIPILLKRNPKKLILVFFIALLVMGIHMLFFPETIKYWEKEAFRFTFPICIPTAMCVVSIRDRYIFYYVLKYLSYVSGFLCLVYCGRILLGLYDLEFSYNQGIGYILLFPILVLFYQQRWFSVLFSAVLFLLLLMFGSRAPLVSIGLFFVYTLLSEKKIGVLFIIILLIIAIIPLLLSFIESMGFSSRTLELYLSGDLNSDNGRDDVSSLIWAGIKQNPYGWGLFGDRVATYGETYAHSIVREIICDLGVILGPIVLLLFFYNVVVLLFKLKGGDRDIYALFAFACLAPILFSGSFLTNVDFYLFVGLFFLLKKGIKRQSSPIKRQMARNT